MNEGWHVEDRGTGEVEFVIGMRWRDLWRLVAHPWVPLAFAQMLRPRPGAGMERTRFAIRVAGPVVVQRWRSREQLDRWARDAARPHALAWARFRREATGTAAWGVWHEVRNAS